MRRVFCSILGASAVVVLSATGLTAQTPDEPFRPGDDPGLMAAIPGNTNPEVAAGQEVLKGKSSLKSAQKSVLKAQEAEGKKRTKLEAKAEKFFQDAEKSFRNALQYDAELVDAYVGLGQTWQATGEYEKALSAWMAARKRSPEDGEILYGAGSSLVRLDRPREAASIYSGLAAADPERAGQLLDDLRVWGEEQSANGNEMAPQLLAWIEQQR